MPEPGPGIRLEVDRLEFGGEVLIENLALDLPGGAWTCLLGPSGIGKSTLLRLVAGILPGGRATALDGRPLQGRCALMAQSDLLLPWLDVVDNVLLGHRLRGSASPALRERAMALLEEVGLADDAAKLPGQLSGGMRQRAALARTLLEDRPVVLMDEPFSALDAIGRHRLQDLAARLLAGRTVLMVTHAPLEALRLGERILVMGGRPATLRGTETPAGAPPRPIADPRLLALQATLLDELAASAKGPLQCVA